MEYRKLGRTGLKVSEICLGTATFGWPADQEESVRMLDMFFEEDGNFIDTADIYHSWVGNRRAGRSEEIIGGWLKDSGKRHSIVLATKCRGVMSPLPNDQGLSRRHIMDAVEASLKRLDTHFIDLYQTHSMDNETPIEETMRALDDLVHQGKVRYLGCSNYSAWRLCQALWVSNKNNLARYECLQPEYSLIKREEFERETADLVKEEELAVIPYSPQGGGLLTGKFRKGKTVPENTRVAENDKLHRYLTEKNFKLIDEMEEIGRGYGKSIAQVSLAWQLSNPLITAPIVGARKVEQLKESIGAVGFRLSVEEMEKLNQLSEWRDVEKN